MENDSFMKNDQPVSLSNTIYSRVADSLRGAIINGEFDPGQRLKMSDLIIRFGTSQMPIREALQQLQGEGLVTILPHRGAQVKSIDNHFIKNIYDLRIAIESFLLRKACESVDTDWIENLKKAQDIYDSLIEKKNIPRIIEANHHFHRIHNSVAENQVALDTLERTNRLVTALRTAYGYHEERFHQVSAEHRGLIKCLEKKDINGALDIHINHVENGRSNMLLEISQIKKNEESG